MSLTPPPTVISSDPNRRETIKWVVAAGTGVSGFVGSQPAWAIFDMSLIEHGRSNAGKGYGLDPDFMKAYKPGDFWPLTMTKDQRRLTRVLADIVIPADENGPGAAAIKIDEFMDEWVSAPYPNQVNDRKIVLEGFVWLDAESTKRFKKTFVRARKADQLALLEDIAYIPNAQPELKAGAQFFDRFRDLVATGYYTTPEGMKDIGYIGNVPMKTFDGPPLELLEKLGLA